jgi:hypothetical protein
VTQLQCFVLGFVVALVLVFGFITIKLKGGH